MLPEDKDESRLLKIAIETLLSIRDKSKEVIRLIDVIFFTEVDSEFRMID
jgi:hypothetical protein